MKLLLASILIFYTSFALADECLKYSEQVTLQGVLSEQTFPEQPNYESIENGDAPATYLFISPHKPFCVSEGKASDGLEPAEAEISQVQLIFTGNAKESYAVLRPYLGKEVTCAGSFMHLLTGHHHSPVLLWKATCTANKK